MTEQKIINNALRFVIDVLEPVNHYPYHNINHTLDVYARCDYLCDKEFVHLGDKTDVLLAALFHDTGFTARYAANEPIGADIAKRYLTGIGWPPERIRTIEGIILATAFGTEPANKLEQIIQDADLDNLGRVDCLVKTALLKKEMRLINKIDIPPREWYLSAYNLLRDHRYNTLTSKIERDPTKQENIKKIEEKIASLK